MSAEVSIREIRPDDFDQWRPLWDGYNAFYERVGPTAVSEAMTRTTWARFLDASEPMFALVAESASGRLVGLVHCLYHRHTVMMADVCYLSDLFTAPDLRGQGVGRALIEAVYARAKAAGSQRVYWLTHETNAPGRILYDKVATNSGFIVYRKEL